MQEQCFSLKEVARLLSIHRQSVWRLIKSGKLNAVNVTEGRRVILKSELDRYLESLK